MFEEVYVEIIVPLAVGQLYTYRVPDELSEEVEVGKRVIVQFGASRFYTGIIAKIRKEAEGGEKLKSILEVIDESPIIHDFQLGFWTWISEYYLCTIGEVMNAALPSTMQLVSETKIRKSLEGPAESEQLSDHEFLIAEALSIEESLTLKQVSDILGIKSVHKVVFSLVEKNVAIIEEELNEKFKPLVKNYLQVTLPSGDKQEVEQILKRAPEQLRALNLLLEKQTDSVDIERSSFIKEYEVSRSALVGLQKRGLLEVREKEVGRFEEFNGVVGQIQKLSPDQEKAYSEISSSFDKQKICLLHGVTGSGKTEVYIKLIADQLKLGKQVLYLLPEIALTAQLVERIQKVFGNQVAVFHSKFNAQERSEIWMNALNGSSNARVIIGARSAVFLPFKNLGLTIVDESHDASFKQQDPSPRYQGRDVAIYLSFLNKANCILGTATPSIESYHNVQQGKYALVELTKRFSGTALPEIQCVDLADRRKKKKMQGVFSEDLVKEIKENLKADKQVILFQNRRGYAPMLLCDSCGSAEKCTKCDVSLTYHKHSELLKCHYCGYTKKMELECSSCGSIQTNLKGFGTEQIKEDLEELFPEAVVERMDLDTTRGKNNYESLIHRFDNKEIDILVGTQMVTKGLDFQNVQLVGVMNADQSLNYPDFRSFERAFQLFSQVSGRAGRRSERGKVIIQTYQPYHSVIRDVMEGRYDRMYKSELEERRLFEYPPFVRLINVTFKNKNRDVLDAAAKYFTDVLITSLGSKRVLGPEYPHVSRVRNLYLKTTLIKFEKNVDPKSVKEIIRQTEHQMKNQGLYKSVRVQVDVDPV